MKGWGILIRRRVWERSDPVGWILWLLFLPFSLGYLLVVQSRNLLYSVACLRGRELPCPVVSVGNLTVGGTGKTPTTLWLAQELAGRGYRVAILSRGYKRKGSRPETLLPGYDPSVDSLHMGDEPAVMAAIYGQRVGVGRKRDEVGDLLLGESEIDVFLLDDGFQHRRLVRNLDLLLLGEDWEGWLLPSGPFREPWGALKRAHLYLITGSREKWNAILTRRVKHPQCFYGSLEPKGLVVREDHRWEELPLAAMSGSRILAVSGIANSASFYRMIQDWGGEIVDTVQFPDHHNYTTKDWQKISRAARWVDRVITTEKDMIKLTRFPFARDKLYALRVTMAVEEGEKLVDAVEEALRAKRNG